MSQGGIYDRTSAIEDHRVCDRHVLGIGLDHDRVDHGPSSYSQGGMSLSRERMLVIVGELYRRGLTKREVEICVEFHDLPSNKILMARLGVAEDTVKMHLNNVFRKLSVPNRFRLFGLLELMIQERQPLPIGVSNFGSLPHGKVKS